MICKVILLFVLLTLVKGEEDTVVTLSTPDASVTGNREPLDRVRRSYYAFKGIEYAQAERWKEPSLKELKGNVKATHFGTFCPQWSLAGQRPVGLEECLFLNVYSPEFPGSRQDGRSSNQYPVMVFFHPGAYMYGSGDQAGPRKLLKHDVILVTVNSRLGVFGYLSTGDNEIPGNFGALDQIKALEWVNTYIRFFGGNAGRVTIFGNSAGASSVHLLMLSPLTYGLFQRAIMQSGSALCDWSIESDPAEYADSIGEAVECSGNSADLAKCLRGKTIHELISAQQGLIKLWMFPVRTAPVVDTWREDPFLPDEPVKLMEEGNFTQIPVMTGVVHDEGLMGYADIHLSIGNTKFTDPTYFDSELIPNILNTMLDNDLETEVVVDAVKTQYFEGIQIGNEDHLKMQISQVVELIGDLSIYSCHWNLLEKLAKHSSESTYSYVFTHSTKDSPNILKKQIGRLRTDMKIQHYLYDYGISHCEELLYLFEPFTALPGLNDLRYQEVDHNVSAKMTELWVNFASNKAPGVGWRPVREESINYYNITSIGAPMGQDYRKGEAIFWTRTVPYIRALGANISELKTYSQLFWIVLGLFIAFFVLTLILSIILWRKRASKAVNL